MTEWDKRRRERIRKAFLEEIERLRAKEKRREKWRRLRERVLKPSPFSMPLLLCVALFS